MRILFCSVGAVGHLLPMIELASALTKHGHRVSWATSRSMHRWFAGREIEPLAVGEDIAVYRDQTLSRWPMQPSLDARERADNFAPKLFGLIAAELLEPLRQAVEITCPDLIVYEPGVLAAPLLAAKYQIRSVHHAFGIRRPWSRLARFAAEVEPLWQDAGLSMPTYGSFAASAFIDLTPPSIGADQLPSVIHRISMQPPVNAWQPNQHETTGVAKWLMQGSDKPLVYLTFGTVQHANPQLTLAANALASLPIRLLVTTAHEASRRDIAALGNHVCAAEFVPQRLALKHALVVVSHAGSGTFLGALAAGVSQLALPQAADQFINAEALARASAGIALDSNNQTTDHIARSVTQLIEDVAIATQARRIASEIATMPSVADVTDRLVSSCVASPTRRSVAAASP